VTWHTIRGLGQGGAERERHGSPKAFGRIRPGSPPATRTPSRARRPLSPKLNRRSRCTTRTGPHRLREFRDTAS